MATRKLSDKTAVITGGATGIGQAIACLFAEHGCRIILLDISSCEQTLGKLARSSAKHIALQCDNADEQCILRCIDCLRQEHGIGCINILVNNACRYVYQSILSASASDWDASFAVNLKGHAMVIKALCADDGQRGWRFDRQHELYPRLGRKAKRSDLRCL